MSNSKNTKAKKQNPIQPIEVSSIINVVELKVKDIVQSAFNPRESFDEKALEELRASIIEHGVLSPIEVRLKNGKYEIVFGERRWRASELAGKETIPAIVRELSDSDAEDRAIVENLIREDISPLEESKAFNRLIEKGKYDVKGLAERSGKSLPYIYGRMRLANIIPEFEELFRNNTVNLGVLLEVVNLDKETQEELFNDHFAEDVPRWNSWREQRTSSLKKSIVCHYTSDISRYISLYESCGGCPQNSATGSLFTDTAEQICYKPACLRNKLAVMLFDKINQLSAEFPDYPIEALHGGNTKTLSLLKEQGVEVFYSYEYDIYPSQPKERKRGDYGDDETYLINLDEYKEEVNRYEEEIKNIALEIDNGITYKRILFSNDEVVIAYAYVEDKPKGSINENEQGDEQVEQAQDETPANARIREISEQITRTKKRSEEQIELRERKIREDCRQLLKDANGFFGEFTDMEERLMYIVMLSSMSVATRKKYKFSEWGICEKDEQWVLDNFTDEVKLDIKRDFVAKYLKDGYSGGFATKALFEFSEQHFPQEYKAIDKEHTATMQKRQESSAVKISGLEKLVEQKKEKSKVDEDAEHESAESENEISEIV